MKGLFGATVGADLVERAAQLFKELDTLPLDDLVETINALRLALHAHSPFKTEPVDCVQWIAMDAVTANDYNPNTVAPPEMRLLERSIEADGYTQPIVAWAREETYEVVDGFHRNRVGRESPTIQARIRGYLPLSIINSARDDRGDRIAATIRHNRARGKHQVEAMSDIVVELKRRNWAEERICKELGMDPDEVLRLCQITGLTEVFSNQEFSRSWDVEGEVTESDFAELTDAPDDYRDVTVRTVNTNDPGRIFHTHDKWECHQAGLYASTKDGMSKAECETAYRDFLADIPTFAKALEAVISTWTHSCEHYLTNVAMNRIAWLGQASACYALGIPAAFRSGYHLLTPTQQRAADLAALDALNQWLVANGRATVSLEAAYSYERQMDIY